MIKFFIKLFARKPEIKKTKEGMCYRHYWGSDSFENCPDCGFSKTFTKHED